MEAEGVTDVDHIPPKPDEPVCPMYMPALVLEPEPTWNSVVVGVPGFTTTLLPVIVVAATLPPDRFVAVVAVVALVALVAVVAVVAVAAFPFMLPTIV